MDNVKEIGRLSDKLSCSRLNQEEIEIMNNTITTTEIEAVIKNLTKNKKQTKKKTGPDGFTEELCQTFRGEIKPILLKLFQNFQTHSMRPPLPRYQNQTKTAQKKENGRPILLMNIDTKIFNKILANGIQLHTRMLIHREQVVFIPGMQGFFNICKSINMIYHMNKLKDKNHMIILIDAEKDFDKF